MARDLSKLTFPGQEPGEEVKLLLRRHWLILVGHVVSFLALAIVLIIILYVLRRYFPEAFEEPVRAYTVVLATGYGILIWVGFFIRLIDYYLDIWIVTNERIINIEQERLFNRTVSEQPLYRVQDVTSEVKGFFRTILKFGDVYVQTAGARVRFIFEQVPHPNRVKAKIIDLHESIIEREGLLEVHRKEKLADGE